MLNITLPAVPATLDELLRADELFWIADQKRKEMKLCRTVRKIALRARERHGHIHLLSGEVAKLFTGPHRHVENTVFDSSGEPVYVTSVFGRDEPLWLESAAEIAAAIDLSGMRLRECWKPVIDAVHGVRDEPSRG